MHILANILILYILYVASLFNVVLLRSPHATYVDIDVEQQFHEPKNTPPPPPSPKGKEITKGSKHDAKGNVSVAYIVVHIDLKGAPPKLNYLEALLPVMKKYGANGILIEYEDMFPYEGKLLNLSAVNCYKKEDLFKFISMAVKEGFEVIPLIQTFGHLEHVLKLEEFQHLREDPKHFDSICPSKKEGYHLIAKMISQVIEFHQSIHLLNYIHIGSDEVYHLNKCGLCKKRQLKTEDLFLKHVVKIASVVKYLHPYIEVLMWDDMLRNIDEKFWNMNQLSKYVQPVYWTYQGNLGNPYKNVYRYHKYFNASLWVASAFKGADGRMQILPNLTARFENHFSWMKFMKDFSNYQPVKFKGIFLTGWSRYSHFDPLCDLLPASVPSLMLSLITVNECNRSTEAATALQGDNEKFYSKFIEKRFHESIGCKHYLKPPLEYIDLSHCRFPEHNIYNSMDIVKNLKDNIHTCLNILKYDQSVLGYYIEKGIINSNFLPKYCKQYKLCYDYVNTTKSNLETCLNSYYDNTVISEFIESRLSSDLKYLNDTLFLLGKYSKIRNWKRRGQT